MRRDGTIRRRGSQIHSASLRRAEPNPEGWSARLHEVTDVRMLQRRVGAEACAWVELEQLSHQIERGLWGARHELVERLLRGLSIIRLAALEILITILKCLEGVIFHVHVLEAAGVVLNLE